VRRAVAGVILVADAVGVKHHSAFHRLFAAAEWSLDDLGLAVFSLIEPWLKEGPVMLAVDDPLHGPKGVRLTSPWPALRDICTSV